MIPARIEAHLRERYRSYAHHTHRAAATAQELAAAEHVTGRRVAKAVVVSLGGELALAVVAATDRVNLSVLEEATGARAELLREAEFRERFTPCDAGAEPPFAIFGARIFVDRAFIQQWRIVMAAGTHEDAVVLDTGEWLWCERVQPIVNLGQHVA
jgi:Ala-tRNA(Pro) deacylase